MSIKFYYLDGRGLGEPLRWILAYGGIEHEEIRTPYEQIPPIVPPEIKAKCRWGQLPLVEFPEDGKTLTQSRAIARYFATKSGLVPQTDFESALCDEYVDSLLDLLYGIYMVYLTKDPKEQEQKLKDAIQLTRTKYLEVFESIINANGGNFLVGSGLTWADIYLAFIIDHFRIFLEVDFSEGLPSIKKLTDTVMSTPKIKTWLDKRPSTKL